MKKVFLFFLIICVCGCSNKNEMSGFKHYQLSNFENDSVKYSYYNEKTHHMDEYIIADITPKDSLLNISGLFYQVDDDDYILLDKFEDGNSNYIFEEYNYFSEEKLYVIRGHGATIYEYNLNGPNTQKKDLSSKIKIKLYDATVEKVDNGYIFLEGQDGFSSNDQKHIKCSQKTYDCKIIQ